MLDKFQLFLFSVSKSANILALPTVGAQVAYGVDEMVAYSLISVTFYIQWIYSRFQI